MKSSHSIKRYLVNWCDAIQCLFTLWCKSPGESSLFVQKCEKKNQLWGRWYKILQVCISNYIKTKPFWGSKKLSWCSHEQGNLLIWTGVLQWSTYLEIEMMIKSISIWKEHEKLLIVFPNLKPRRQWRTQNTLAHQSANFVVTLSTLVSYCEQWFWL